MKTLAARMAMVVVLGFASLVLAFDGYVAVLEHPTAGEYLTDVEGKSLYIFTNDTVGEGTSACYGGCAGAWPPYLVDTAEIHGHDDFIGELTVITRTDGTLQLAYNGMPLYYFAGDGKAGDSNGHEMGGVWFLAAYAQEAKLTGSYKSDY